MKLMCFLSHAIDFADRTIIKAEKIIAKTKGTGLEKVRSLITNALKEMSKKKESCPDGLAKLEVALADTFYVEGGRYANPKCASDLALYHLQVAKKSIGIVNTFPKIEADILRRMGRVWHEHIGHENIKRNTRAIDYYKECMDVMESVSDVDFIQDKLWTRALIAEAQHDIASTDMGRQTSYKDLEAIFAEAGSAQFEDLAQKITVLISELKNETRLANVSESGGHKATVDN